MDNDVLNGRIKGSIYKSRGLFFVNLIFPMLGLFPVMVVACGGHDPGVAVVMYFIDVI